MTLTGKQRQFLKGLAHPLSPLVRLGKGGLTDAVINETRKSLHSHELIKVRIDVDESFNTPPFYGIPPTNPGSLGPPETWAKGMRNPWRFSFDRGTSDLYIGDVGQNVREEIDVAVVPNAGRQANYGWRLMEGFLCFNPSSSCNSGGLTLPVLDYPHASGACSVTGGYVYRGGAIPSSSGTYFYGDFCAGFVRSFRYQNGQATEQTEWPLLSPPGSFVTSFGEDASGELYVMTQGGGLFKFIPN